MVNLCPLLGLGRVGGRPGRPEKLLPQHFSDPGDDENWMKHTLSWLDKPYVEDAKVPKRRVENGRNHTLQILKSHEFQ